MVSSLFPPRLRALIAKALGSSTFITQSDLDNLWIGYGSYEGPLSGNKPSKANTLVRSIAQGSDADDQFLAMLNDVYYTSGEGDRRRNDAEAFKPLLVDLLRRGFIIDEDEGIQKPALKHSSVSEPASKNQVVPAHVPGSTATPTVRTEVDKIGDGRSVFIVHGRNTAARDELAKFLRHLDAKPISWTEAAALTKKPSPTTMEIINAGMAKAQAIVVIFTPDDEAQLKSKYVKADDGLHEKQLTGQARQNVLLEAGMALGAAPGRTVLVRLGQIRMISDIEGINWIDLGDGWDARTRLRDALVNANVSLELNKDLTAPDAGKFAGIDLGQTTETKLVQQSVAS
ncbi:MULTISPECIES: nucleotide-binding protein [unclassified Arthrobacter]|uniref:nucleotide-binding protein n=1 Tax=unclassified Arthrobacter TaxID=235627 RepID=UPI002DF9163E|nr:MULTISPECIES: nucleotide-binding protein [unclassified Arthrobacter]MEC5193098.1 putative nucleotide-binding protein [Arthrobacter sp. MP_M4]MEC5204876.1 putative nucleotide-binding protein [Arthrobacter sp. MP_M7]